MSRLLVSMFTDKGAVRDHNEDRLAFRQFRHPTGNYELLAVADGMGGHARGEVAAQVALQALEEFLGFGAWTDPGDALERAFQLANQRVHDEGGGMGTTLVAVLVDVQTLETWVANVGDSRAYVLRPTGPEALTRDHSEVAARVEAGLLTREEAELVDGRNVLLRAIGPDPEVEVDVSPPFELREGERLLLCSDGLHGMLPERQFLEMANSAGLGSEPAKLLAEAAIAAGGRDNVTVILAAPATEETVRMGSFPAPGRIRRSRRIPLQTLAATIGAIVIGLAAGGLVFSTADRGGGGVPTTRVPGKGQNAPENTPTTSRSLESTVPMSSPEPAATAASTVPTTPAVTPPFPNPTLATIPPPASTPAPTATPTPTPADTPTPTPTATPSPSATPTATAVPPTATPVPPTAAAVPPPISGLKIDSIRNGQKLQFTLFWDPVGQANGYKVNWRSGTGSPGDKKVVEPPLTGEVTADPKVCFWVTVVQNPSQRSDEVCEP